MRPGKARLARTAWSCDDLLMRTLISLLVWLLLTACNSPHPDRSGELEASSGLRVLTYNIHHGAGTDGVIDLERIAAVIRAADADLVALQEVDRGVERTGRVDQPTELAALTGMRVIFEKNITYQGGDYGNAVLTRLPVLKHTNHYLPQTRPGEQRGMLEVHVIKAGRPMVFFATHFDYHADDTERLASADMLRGLVEGLANKQVVVAGDLNTTPGSAVMGKLESFLQDSHRPEDGSGYTYPAGEPDRRIDYVLSHPESGYKVVSCRVMDEAVASDHRPLLVEFE